MARKLKISINPPSTIPWTTGDRSPWTTGDQSPVVQGDSKSKPHTVQYRVGIATWWSVWDRSMQYGSVVGTSKLCKYPPEKKIRCCLGALHVHIACAGVENVDVTNQLYHL